MTRNILITGGAGFIGSRLAFALRDRKHNVRVLDCLSAQVHGESPELPPLFQNAAGAVEFQRGDVTRVGDLAKALDGIDTVVHLAAETGTGQSMYAIRHYSDVNIGGTALLLDLIANKALPVKTVIVASSRAVYGEGKYSCDHHGTVYPGARRAQDMACGDFGVHCPLCDREAQMMPTDETTPTQPTSVYGITKLNQEQMVLTVGRALGINAIAYRYQNVYGPGQSLSNPYTGILSIFSTRIRHGKDINIFEDGQESRDFVYVDDVVNATVAGVEYEQPIVDVFNVGSGEAISVSTVVDTLQEELGQKVSVTISGQFRLGDIRHNLADLSKIHRVFNYTPVVSFNEGIKRFSEWAGSEVLQHDRYERSLAELRDKGLLK